LRTIRTSAICPDRFERAAARQSAERNAHPTSTPNDAWGVQFGGNADLTTSVRDRRYCNSNNVCKRNGQDDASGNLVSGTDDLGHNMSAGVFPYRTNASNSSAAIFGLPEMMPIEFFPGPAL